MFENLKNMANLRKQAMEVKKQMDSECINGEGYHGKIRITMDGSQQIKEVFVDESLLAPENKSNLESGIKEAFTKANKELQMIMMRKMQSGEINMPQL